MQHHTLFSYENIKFSVHGENFKENLVLKNVQIHIHIYIKYLCVIDIREALILSN